MRFVILSLLCIVPVVWAGELELSHFKNLVKNNRKADKSAALIKANWSDAYTPLIIESYRFSRDVEQRGRFLDILQNSTDFKGGTLDDLLQWGWQKTDEPHSEYAGFKEFLYERIDRRFSEYFDDNPESIIRLDEIRWGGVKRDGIPPLKNPKVVPATKAKHMQDDHVVFGVSFNGESRAYPKRILAWHEMVKDHVGGVSINGVYCTLCGSMIVYDTNFQGKHYELGTSGFLYRSNKLMYDHDTKSMWSTIEGKPVVGPLVGKGIQLKPLYVVTSTWGEWKRRHPDTTVLTLNTGHKRDYGEGVAYREYFSTDQLMFDIPTSLKDNRLKNKDSVLAFRFGDAATDKVAFSPQFLKSNPLHHYSHGDTSIVIVSDKSGASRAYEAQGVTFKDWDTDKTLTDKGGVKWTLNEDELVNDAGKVLKRFPAHNAFWFGWHSAYPETVLIK